jgi:DNA repair protein RecO (recombination protein O)
VNHLLDQAIVISGRDYRESDRLLRLFTLEHGPLTALARGAKRSSKRFGGALEPFSRLEAELSIRDQGLSIIHSANTIMTIQTLFRDLDRFAQAAYACELADRFLPEHLPNPRLFRLLATYLEQLGAEAVLPLPALRRFFEINLLNILGYRPDLRTQVATNLLSPATADTLSHCLATGRFSAIIFTDEALAEAGRMLDLALASHLDRPLKSLEFLLEIGTM